MTFTAKADVVIPVYRDHALVDACIASVLAHTGDALRKVILVEDASPEPEVRDCTRRWRDREPRIRLIENEENLGFVTSCNRGLTLRDGHAVVLNSDARVTDGWLEELLGVLAEAPALAAVAPLSNNATLCSVPNYVTGSPVEELEGVNLELDGLPRWTVMPTAVGFCLLMRGEALDLLGGFDPAFGRGYHEENDWCQRAQHHGWQVARANRAFVFHHGEVSFGADRPALDLVNGRRLVARYPAYLDQNQAFDRGPSARVAAIAVRASLPSLSLRIAFHGADSRLVAAIADLPRLEIASDDRDVDLVHASGLPRDRETLDRLLDAPSRLIWSLPDPVELTAPHSPWSESAFQRGAAWHLARAADRLVASSAQLARSLAQLLDVDLSRIDVVAPGFDASSAEPATEARGAGLHLVLDDVLATLAIDAWSHVRLDSNDRSLVLVSERPLDFRVPAWVTSIVAERSHWPSFVRGAGCLLQPANRSDARNLVLEAVAAQVPAVVAGTFGLDGLALGESVRAATSAKDLGQAVLAGFEATRSNPPALPSWADAARVLGPIYFAAARRPDTRALEHREAAIAALRT